MEVRFSRSARKELRKTGPAKDLILAKIKQYVAEPASLASNVKSLKGRDQYRLRVGDYRVLFVIEGSIAVMLVTSVRHRSKVYE